MPVTGIELVTFALRMREKTYLPAFILMAELATIVRNTCRTPNAGADAPTFEVLTTPNVTQQRMLELLQQIRL